MKFDPLSIMRARSRSPVPYCRGRSGPLLDDDFPKPATSEPVAKQSFTRPSVTKVAAPVTTNSRSIGSPLQVATR
jgi:hypothetical protein